MFDCPVAGCRGRQRHGGIATSGAELATSLQLLDHSGYNLGSLTPYVLYCALRILSTADMQAGIGNVLAMFFNTKERCPQVISCLT